MQQLKSGFKWTVNWSNINQNQDHLFDPSSQGVNELYVSSFEGNVVRTWHTGYILGNVNIKDYNVMTDGRKCFDQPIKNDIRTFNKILKIAKKLKKMITQPVAC